MPYIPTCSNCGKPSDDLIALHGTIDICPDCAAGQTDNNGDAGECTGCIMLNVYSLTCKLTVEQRVKFGCIPF